MKGKLDSGVMKKIVLNRKVIYIGLFIFFMIAIWGTFIAVNNYISMGYTVVDDSYSYCHQIDSVAVEDNKLKITGWFFVLEEDTDPIGNKSELRLILRDVETEKSYYLDTEQVVRTDVNDYFLCEYDYSNCGFAGEIKTNKLSLEDSIYEILIRNDMSEKGAVSTGNYVVDGNLEFINPNGFVEPKLEGTDIEFVIKEGDIRDCRPEHGIYIYQYKDKLYWIADEKYSFEKNGSSLVQCEVATTQPGKLYEYGKPNRIDRDNRGFVFEGSELRDVNTGEYRVAVREIPDEYSVTGIWTGCHIRDEGWVWLCDFRPRYSFTKE